MVRNVLIILLAASGVILITDISVIALGDTINTSSVGVKTGDTFNFEVMENPRGNRQRDGSWTPPEDFTMPENFTHPEGQPNPGGSPGSFIPFFGDLEISDFTLNPIIQPLPSEGVVFSIKLLNIPNDTVTGKLAISIKGDTSTYDTDFSYGSPIIYTDWNGWINVLNSLEEEVMEASDNIESVTVDITTNTENIFETAIVFTIEIPEEQQDFLQALQITQYTRYKKQTGIQDMICVESKMENSFMGETIQTTRLDFTTKDATPPDSTDIFSSLFLIGLILLSFVGIGAIVVKRTRSQVGAVQKDIKVAQRKTIEKERSQIQDIKARIAEIEKQERISLEKAESSLRSEKKFKRRKY